MDEFLKAFAEEILWLIFDFRRLYKNEPNWIRFLPLTLCCTGVTMMFFVLIFDAEALFPAALVILAASFVALILRFLIKKFRSKKRN